MYSTLRGSDSPGIVDSLLGFFISYFKHTRAKDTGLYITPSGFPPASNMLRDIESMMSIQDNRKSDCFERTKSWIDLQIVDSQYPDMLDPKRESLERLARVNEEKNQSEVEFTYRNIFANKKEWFTSEKKILTAKSKNKLKERQNEETTTFIRYLDPMIYDLEESLVILTDDPKDNFNMSFWGNRFFFIHHNNKKRDPMFAKAIAEYISQTATESVNKQNWPIPIKAELEKLRFAYDLVGKVNSTRASIMDYSTNQSKISETIQDINESIEELQILKGPMGDLARKLYKETVNL